MNRFVQWFFNMPSDEAPEGSLTEFFFAGLPRGDDAWLAWLAIVGCVLLVIALYRFESQLSRGRRLVLGVLRLLALAIVVLMLFDPQLRTEVLMEYPGRTLVLYDASGSMQERDNYTYPEQRRLRRASGADFSRETPSRLSLAKAATQKQDLLKKLSKRNRVRLFAFDTELRPVKGLSDVAENTPTSNGTHLGDALRSGLRAAAGQPISAAVVLSDGRRSGGASLRDVAVEFDLRGVPIHTVGLGKGKKVRNAAVRELVAPQAVPVGFPVQIETRIEAQGLKEHSLRVTLTRLGPGRGDPQTIDTRDLDVDAYRFAVSLSFVDTLSEKGSYRYLVSVSEVADEDNRRDNVRDLQVVATEESSPVLLYAGSATPEYKFLRNFLLRDKGVQVACWLNSADVGYPQDGDILLRRAPQTKLEIKAFDVVILLDPVPDEMTGAFLSGLESFVRKDGGGLVLVAGENCQADARGLDSIKLLLPVELRDPVVGRRYADPWRPQLTAKGREHPFFSLDDDPAANRALWSRLPPFYFYASTGRLRPAATSLATHPDGEVLIALQHAGAGNVLYLGTDDFHRWRTTRRGLHERFWSGIVRYLAAARKLAAGRHGTLFASRDRYVVGESVSFEAVLLERSGEPILLPSLEVKLKTGSGAGSSLQPTQPERTVRLLPIDGRPGWYRGAWRAVTAGNFSAEIVDGAQTSFTVVNLLREGLNVAPDFAALEELALDTGGQFWELDALPALADAIPQRKEVDVVGRSFARLWDSAGVMICLCGILIIEWFLRKWWRLH